MKLITDFFRLFPSHFRLLACGTVNFFYLLLMEPLDLILNRFSLSVIRLKLLLWRFYRFSPPHRLVEKQLPSHPHQGADLIYGEPFIFTLKKMFKRVNLKPEETLLDIGCGRGLGIFTAALFFQAQALGIEIIPDMVRRARIISRLMKIEDRAAFWPGDFLAGELPQADVIYLCGTTFSPETRKLLTEKLEILKPGTRLISLSYPLLSKKIKLKFSEKLFFSWGKATVYYQEIIQI